MESTPHLKLKCGNCAKAIRVPESMLGRSGNCPNCGERINVPTGTKSSPESQVVKSITVNHDGKDGEQRRFFVVRNENRQGPFSDEQIVALGAQGRLLPTDRIEEATSIDSSETEEASRSLKAKKAEERRVRRIAHGKKRQRDRKLQWLISAIFCTLFFGYWGIRFTKLHLTSKWEQNVLSAYGDVEELSSVLPSAWGTNPFTATYEDEVTWLLSGSGHAEGTQYRQLSSKEFEHSAWLREDYKDVNFMREFFNVENSGGYIKGKLLTVATAGSSTSRDRQLHPYEIENNCLDGLFLRLPQELQAANLDEAETIIWLGWRYTLTDEETHTERNIQNCYVAVVDRAEKKVVDLVRIISSDDGHVRTTKRREVRMSGSRPDEQILDYLKSLPRK